ncbi:MAG: Crp/Fnr family transcriptional regulator [Thermosynechococcaceae cyanobacterium MS004]|nr:Crp/Fnr family transcriptional regulator [Thermosynechococcaceae cyanobacterium MS004]
MVDWQFFKPKDLLPTPHSSTQKLWMIEQGIVKTETWNQAGEGLLLAIWGAGDLVALPLTRIGYQITCLTPVKARLVSVAGASLQDAMAAQIQQLEFLLELMHCLPLPARIIKLLGWLAQKTGCVTTRGCMINLHLTHQAISEMLGTTRVTVTRLLMQLEAEGKLEKLSHQRILLLEGWQNTLADSSPKLLGLS